MPVVLRQRVLQLAHEGHPSIVRMKQRCRASVWWSGINGDIECYVQHLVAYAMSGKANQPVASPLQLIALPPEPWHTTSIDIFGEVQWAPAHQRYLIVVSDLYSKWKEVAMRSTMTSSAVIEVLTEQYARYDIPRVFISDNGAMFTSAEFKAFVASSGIKHNLAALYHSQSNGVTERFNKVLKEGLTIVRCEGTPFTVAVRNILVNYCSLPHATTGY